MSMIQTPDGNRITPSMPAGAYKTYQILAPVSTHFRDAGCEEVACQAHLYGFKTVVDESNELGQRQAHYIRKQAGRRFTEARLDNGLTEFTFEAGQRCFQGPHKVRVDRDEHFIVRGGDWRGNPTGERYQHTSASSWQEDFAEHQDHIHNLIERG